MTQGKKKQQRNHKQVINTHTHKELQVPKAWQVVRTTDNQLALILMNLSCTQVFHFGFDSQPKADIFWGVPSQLLCGETGRESSPCQPAFITIILLPNGFSVAARELTLHSCKVIINKSACQGAQIFWKISLTQYLLLLLALLS